MRTQVDRSTYDELVTIEQAELATISSVFIFLSVAIGWSYRRYEAERFAAEGANGPRA